ncbi:MAG TPA: tetratricopeptide repeat protein, partial [Lentimicrobium sp.]|nr:tetratricopeptide repeat protein [Lentimicrobium sp.]
MNTACHYMLIQLRIRIRKLPAVTGVFILGLLLVAVIPAPAQVLPSVEALVKQAEEVRNTNPPQALVYATQALELARKTKHKPSLARAHRYIGVIYFMTGNLDVARQQFDSSYALYTKLKDQKGIAACLNNIGVIYQEKGEYPEAIRYFEQSIALKTKLGDIAGATSGMLNT